METNQNTSKRNVWQIILQALSAAIGAILGTGAF